jgi:hypothetical protein
MQEPRWQHVTISTSQYQQELIIKFIKKNGGSAANLQMKNRTKKQTYQANKLNILSLLDAKSQGASSLQAGGHLLSIDLNSRHAEVIRS